MKKVRKHPHLIELNARNWLWQLQKKYARNLTLSTIPDQEIDNLKELGFDLVWLMGIWKPSLEGIRTKAFSPELQQEYSTALPHWTETDIVGSPYAIMDYTINPMLGTVHDLEKFRKMLHDRAMLLICDFVPNHIACDHAWVRTKPEYFVQADNQALQENRTLFFPVSFEKQRLHLAHGRDPFFAPWTDTVQLNYFNPDTRQAMLRQVSRLSEHCDGLRCDMAMLILNEIHQRTWGWLLNRLGYEQPHTEFWEDAISSVRKRYPNFVFIAEAYWNTEWQLLQLGFDYTYDKELYDRLRFGTSQQIREHLQANKAYQQRSVRFIENHDEARALTVFGKVKVRAATVVMSTIPGLRLYHQGQLEGKLTKLPVQLLATKDDPLQDELHNFFLHLHEVTRRPVFHEGQWRLLETLPAWSNNSSHEKLLAWEWTYQEHSYLVVVNWADHRSQGRVIYPDLQYSEPSLRVYDHLSGSTYTSKSEDVRKSGLYIELDPYGCHILEFHQKQ